MELREQVARGLWEIDVAETCFEHEDFESERYPTYMRMADAAIAAVLDAMQEPSEAVWDGLPRDLIMWMDMESKTPRGLFRHLKLCRGHVPEWLTKEPEMGNLDHVVSKGSRAVLVWKAMLSAFRTEALGGGDDPIHQPAT